MATACPWGIGAKTKTLIAFEETYGVLPSTVAAKIMPVNSNGVQKTQNMTDAGTLHGGRSSLAPIKGNIDVAGDIVVPVDYKAFGYWLKAMFDTPTTTESSDIYTHVFKIGAGMPSFALEKAFPGITKYAKSVGCKISKMSLGVGGDGELTSTISIVGKSETVGSTSMDSTATDAGFERTENFQAVVKVGGSAVGKVTALNIDIDFGLDTDGYCIGGQGMREAVCDGVVKISGSIEAFYDGNATLESDKTSLEVVFTKGDDSLSIKVPEAMLVPTSPSIDGPAGIKQTVNFNGYHDSDSANSAVVVTLVNDIEEY